MTEQVVEEDLDIRPAEEPWIREIAARHGVDLEVPVSRGLDLLTWTTVVLIGAPHAVRSVLQSVDEFRRGGQVIDLRPGTRRRLRRTTDVMYGYVVIYTADDKVQILLAERHRSDDRTAGQLLQRLLPGSNAQQVREAINQLESEAPGTFDADSRSSSE